MRVDFYRIEGPAGAITKACLASVEGLANDESRTMNIGGVPFRAQELSRIGGRYWIGDMVRIRMTNVPQIVSTAGDTEDINLNDDQGIGEDTAFRYDERTQVLCIQRNRSGVSASNWGTYFQSFGTDGDAIIPTVIPTEATISAILNRLEVVKKIHVRIAGNVNSILAIGQSNDTSTQIRQLAERAPVLEMSLGTGRAGGSLPVTLARQMMRSLYNAASETLTGEAATVERIDVIGTFDDDSDANLNLLDYFMRGEAEVEEDPKVRRVLYADRRRAVDEVWGQNRTHLENRFLPRR